MSCDSSELWVLRGFSQAYGLQPEVPSPTAILIGGGQILAFLRDEEKVCSTPCPRT